MDWAANSTRMTDTLARQHDENPAALLPTFLAGASNQHAITHPPPPWKARLGSHVPPALLFCVVWNEFHWDNRRRPCTSTKGCCCCYYYYCCGCCCRRRGTFWLGSPERALLAARLVGAARLVVGAAAHHHGGLAVGAAWTKMMTTTTTTTEPESRTTTTTLGSCGRAGRAAANNTHTHTHATPRHAAKNCGRRRGRGILVCFVGTKHPGMVVVVVDGMARTARTIRRRRRTDDRGREKHARSPSSSSCCCGPTDDSRLLTDNHNNQPPLSRRPAIDRSMIPSPTALFRLGSFDTLAYIPETTTTTVGADAVFLPGTTSGVLVDRRGRGEKSRIRQHRLGRRRQRRRVTLWMRRPSSTSTHRIIISSSSSELPPPPQSNQVLSRRSVGLPSRLEPWPPQSFAKRRRRRRDN